MLPVPADIWTMHSSQSVGIALKALKALGHPRRLVDDKHPKPVPKPFGTNTTAA